MKSIYRYLKKKLCQKAHKDNEQLRILLENLPEYIYWKDRDCRYQGCNWNVAKAVGSTHPSEIIGQDDRKLGEKLNWSEDRINQILCIDRRVIREGNQLETQEELIMPDGKYQCLLTRKSPLKDADGNIFGLLGVSTDITDLKFFQRELEKTKITIERNLQLVIENLPEYIYWKDTDFIYQGCNKNVADYLNLDSPNEIIGKSDDDFGWTEERTQSLYDIDKQIIKQGISSSIEEVIPKPNGETRNMLTSKSPLRDDSGNIFGILGVSVDITKQKQMEKQVKEFAMREERLKLLSAMGGMIAHELKTPLMSVGLSVSSIKEYLPTLLEAYKNRADSATQESCIPNFQLQALDTVCDDITTALSHAENTITMILGGFKANQTQQKPMIAVNVYTLIDRFLVQYPLSKLETSWISVKKGPEVTVVCHEHIIIYILTNLLKNSLYFINESGKGTVTIWIEKKGTEVNLHFRDTAKGMNKDQLHQIFEPFHSSKSINTSIGMGLYFCKMAIESMKGKIYCQSKLGLFTEFILTFPNTAPH